MRHDADAGGSPELLASKQELRERIWATLTERGHARFPGARNRIPNVTGAEAAAERLRDTDVWRNARTLKCNPDAAQWPVAWSAVYRVAAGTAARPSAALSRPGTIASALGATTLRGATVVTGDGVVHTLPGPGCSTDLWWAFRACPGAVGVVTAVVVDARYTTAVLPRARPAPAALIRLLHLARRHDPAGLLGVPHPQ